MRESERERERASERERGRESERERERERERGEREREKAGGGGRNCFYISPRSSRHNLAGHKAKDITQSIVLIVGGDVGEKK